MYHAWIGLAGGLAACWHCLGMCGGFALHLSRGDRTWGACGRQLAWHAGKTTVYVFLGALAGFGGGLLLVSAALPWLQRGLSWIAGAAMVVMGLWLAGWQPGVGGGRAAGEGVRAGLFRSLVAQPDARGAAVLGMATGFLPCPVVAAFLAYALQTGSVAAGMATMAGVGVGTAGPLLLAGFTGHAVAARFRRRGAAVAGVLLVLLGILTVLRGTDAFHRRLGCPCGSHAAGDAAHGEP